MTPEAALGRLILLVSFAVIVLLDLIPSALRLMHGGPIVEPSIRMILTAGLLWCVWRGMIWAIWVLVALSLAGGLLFLISGLFHLSPMLMFMGVLYLGGAVCLFASPVRAFLVAQRKKIQAVRADREVSSRGRGTV